MPLPLISKLIRDKDHSVIIRLLREKKVSLWDTVVFNSLIKILIYQNNQPIIKVLLEEFPSDLVKNMDGYLPLHIIYEQNNKELVKEYLTKYPQYIDAVNEKNKTTLLHSILDLDDMDMLHFIFSIKPDINVNRHSNTVASALLYSIMTFKGSTDVIKFILDKGADPNLLKPRLCFSHIAKNIRNCAELINLLLEYGADINIPAMPSIFILAHKSSNIAMLNYLTSLDSKYKITIRDIIYCFMEKYLDNAQIINYLYKLDIIEVKGYRDYNMNNLLLIGLYCKVDPEIITHLISMCDINSYNSVGETAVLYLLKNKTYKYYTKILETTFIDIFSNKGITHVQGEDVPVILDIFIKGYINYHKNYNIPVNQYCLKDIKKSIFNAEQCNPKINIPKLVSSFNKNINKTKTIKLATTYIVDIIDVIIYHYRLINAYPDLICIPCVDSTNIDIQINISITETSTSTNNDGLLNPLITETSGPLFYQYYPFILIWRYSKLEIGMHNMEFYLRKALYSKARYILLAVFVGETLLHYLPALFDKVNNMVEMYPIDNIPSNSLNKMEEHVKKLFQSISDNKVYSCRTHYRLNDLHDIKVRLRDINMGVVASMVNLWLVEQRINNPDIPINDLALNTIHIMDVDDNDALLEKFTTYLASLTLYKNDIYDKAGINSIDYYSTSLSDSQKLDISKVLGL